MFFKYSPLKFHVFLDKCDDRISLSCLKLPCNSPFAPSQEGPPKLGLDCWAPQEEDLRLGGFIHRVSGHHLQKDTTIGEFLR